MIKKNQKIKHRVIQSNDNKEDDVIKRFCPSIKEI